MTKKMTLQQIVAALLVEGRYRGHMGDRKHSLRLLELADALAEHARLTEGES